MNRKSQIGLLIVLSLLVYGNTLANSFTMDDELYIFRNPQVTHASVHALFLTNQASNVFRPVTFATLAANWSLASNHAWAYHLVNLLLHAVVTLLLFFLLRALLENLVNGAEIAFAAAALFAAHPIHTEAVASIIGRSELLAAGFLFTAWLLHIRDRWLLGALCFALAVLSKESAIIFLPLALAGDYARRQWKPWPRYAVLAACTTLYLGVLWKAQGGHFGAASVAMLDNPLYRLPAQLRVLNALRIGWKYVGLLIFPWKLSCDYSYNGIVLYGDALLNLPAALAALAVFAAWICSIWKRNVIGILAGAIYFIGFAVTSNILTPTGTIMGERLAYLPSAGFCLLLAYLCARLEMRHRAAAQAALSVVVLAFGVRSVVRNADWRDNLALYSAAIKVVPNSAKMHAYLGGQYLNRRQFDAARTELQTALSIYPDFPDTMESLALLDSWTGNTADALQLMDRALRMSDRTNINYDYMTVNYAALLMESGRTTEALAVLDREIAEAPSYSRAWSNRAALRYQLGQFAYARTDAETALRLASGNAQAAAVLQKLNASQTPANTP